MLLSYTTILAVMLTRGGYTSERLLKNIETFIHNSCVYRRKTSDIRLYAVRLKGGIDNSIQMIEGKEFEGKTKNLVQLELTVQEILETYPVCL